MQLNSTQESHTRADIQAVTSTKPVQGTILPSIGTGLDDMLNTTGVQVSPTSTNTVNLAGGSVSGSKLDAPTVAKSDTSNQGEETIDNVTVREAMDLSPNSGLEIVNLTDTKHAKSTKFTLQQLLDLLAKSSTMKSMSRDNYLNIFSMITASMYDRAAQAAGVSIWHLNDSEVTMRLFCQNLD